MTKSNAKQGHLKHRDVKFPKSWAEISEAGFQSFMNQRHLVQIGSATHSFIRNLMLFLIINKKNEILIPSFGKS